MVRQALGRCVCVLMIAFLVVMAGAGMTACGPTLSGKIDLLKNVVDEPATAILQKDKYLYIVVEDKLFIYDTTNAEDPQRVGQVDAFKGPHVGLVEASGGLVLMGTNGKMMFFSLNDPTKPKSAWGRKDQLDLGVKAGPFLVRPQLSVIYMTPSSGGALVRVALGSLTNFSTLEEAKKELGTAVSKIPGGGGAGVAMFYQKDNSPVRLYVGNKSTGKIDIYLPTAVEQYAAGGGSAPKPTASIELKAGDRVDRLFALDRFLYAGSTGVAEGDAVDFERFDLGRNWVKAGDPTASGEVQVGGIYSFHPETKTILNRDLTVWRYEGDDPTKATKVAELEVRAEINVRGIVLKGDYVYTAEASGFRIYKITK